MQRDSDSWAATTDEEVVIVGRMWDRVGRVLGDFPRYYRLYIILLVALELCAVLMYMIDAPTYTATAVIGPPGPSAANSILSSNSLSDTVESAKHLFGGASAGTENDPFQEYQQLLQSTRLATQLDEYDGLLTRIFAARWDAASRKWRPPSAIHKAVDLIEFGLNRPVRDYPDVDMLRSTLSSALKVTQAPSSAQSLLSMGTSYMIITFTYGDPRGAEDILNIILRRADEIIRQDQFKDVLARIAYINGELRTVTATEEREALIEALTTQEEMKIMMAADQRVAFTMIDPPHAPPLPTWPIAPLSSFLLAGAFGTALYGLVLYFGDRVQFFGWLLRMSNGKKAPVKNTGRREGTVSDSV